MDEEENVEVAEDSLPICPCCLARLGNIHLLHFCGECGAPIGGLAAINPFESIFARGYVYRAAAERPCKLLTVVGIWLLFLPGAFYCLILLSGPGFGFEDLSILAFFAIEISLVVRVTHNYWKKRRGISYPADA